MKRKTNPLSSAFISHRASRGYVAVALCAMMLLYTAAPVAIAQRRAAIRVRAGSEATPAANTTRAKESSRETENERRREGIAARARMKVAAQKTHLIRNKTGNGYEVGVPTTGAVGVERTTADIMQSQSYIAEVERTPRLMLEHDLPSREGLPQNPDAKPVASTSTSPVTGNKVITLKPATSTRGVRGGITPAPPASGVPSADAPQTVSTPNFTGATLAETGAFPPDSMGTVGPTQFVVFVNGRLRTFNKTTGTADGVLNVDPDVFFNPVLTPPASSNFTSDPQVRYDRLSGRWILLIIDVPSGGTVPNRILLAVSDAASAGTISASTVFTFFFVQQDTVGGIPSTDEFLDYPSLGVDAQALYIGGNMFGATSGSFIGTSGFVIRKSSVLGAGPVVTTAFRNLAAGAGAGPESPRGVDNYDPASNEGYFIGPDNASFSTIMLRRVSDPGGTPSISGNIAITVSTTTSPNRVEHLGNTGGAAGNLDSLDDRFFAAHIRNGRLWTAHNFRVSASGVASTSATTARNSVRWYEFNGIRSTDNGGTPVVVQSGTIFDSAATRAAARQYWIPTVMVSGQGHSAFGYSTAGTPNPIDAATNGRLRTDTLGTTQAVALYTNATGNTYNPPSDPGGSFGRRWGDYSFTSLDPQDDMTMWTIQEFCNATNSYGVRIVKLLAPPPASPNDVSQPSIPPGQASVSVVVTGTSVNGSEFYDPGANLAAPALPFNHITATVSGGVTVNSVTYTDPTHVTLNLNTTAATLGPKNITITNPDGQSTTTNNVIYVGAAPPSPVLISEFRFRGSAGGNDEFIEVYNNTNSPITVADSGAGTGYAVVATNATGTNSTRFVIPNGTVIPARGHYLGTNNGATGYSLGAYATGDTTYASGIVDGGGIAVFNTTVAANFSTATRLDAVGFGGITGTTLFTEGTPLTPTGGITTAGVEISFVRNMTSASSGLPQDNNDNNSDFAFVATNGAVISARQSTLGAPGPENLASPIQRNATISLTLLDPAVSSSTAQNRTRNLTSDPANNSTFGTLSIRRTVTNNTGAAVTRLRFRIVDITTFPSPGGGVADLRARTSTPPATVVITGPNPACPANVCPLMATTLETTIAQPNGGGINSSLAAGTVTLGTPLPNGLSINVEFLLGVQQTGTFRFFVNIEALP